VSCTVTFLLYGSLLFQSHEQHVVPAVAAQGVALPFNQPPKKYTRPFQMPYIFMAISSDGMQFTKVPSFSVRQGGTHKMVVAGEQVWVYVSDAKHQQERGVLGGQGLQDIQPVDVEGEAPGQRLDPCVLDVSSPGASPLYRMYYVFAVGNGNPASAESTNEFHCAVSTDGLHFRREPGVIAQGRGITDPDVVRLGDGSYRMFYTQYPGVIKSARSADGRTFQLEGLRLLNAWVSSTRLDDEGRFRLYFQSLDEHLKGIIHTASSPDGHGFNIDGRGLVTAGAATSPDGQGAFHPAVVRRPDGTFVMLYSSGEAFGSGGVPDVERAGASASPGR
jgi:hypothetical protein